MKNVPLRAFEYVCMCARMVFASVRVLIVSPRINSMCVRLKDSLRARVRVSVYIYICVPGICLCVYVNASACGSGWIKCAFVCVCLFARVLV